LVSRITAALLLACATAASLAAEHAGYPLRPIRMVVGFPPGGTADVLARVIARELIDAWGQHVVLDNRPGAGSMIASELVAKSAPDGYTLLMVTSSHAVSATVAKNVAYDPVASFTPIALIAATPLGLIGNLSAPVKSMRELLAYAKANPGKLNYGSSGSGSTTHLAGELLGTMAGIKLVHVPYRGGAPSMNELLGGQIPLLVISWPSALAQIKASKVTGLGITSTTRSAAMPEVPTIAEAGVPGYEALQWYAVLAPAAVPPPVAQKINREITRIMHLPKVAAFVAGMGAEAKTSTTAEFQTYLRAETAKWTKLAQPIGATTQ
jgi:tripartite-type tricarboxylate transporter receptor subunit TctC